MTTSLIEPDVKKRGTGIYKKLNRTTVDSIEHPIDKKQHIYIRDEALQGFALRVTSGSKTYIAEGWVQGETRESCRYTIGKHGKITCEQARKEAARVLNLMATGVNPNREKKKAKEVQQTETIKSKTLAEIWEDYKIAKNLAPTTTYDNEGILRRCFGDWLDKPLSRITMDMIIQKHSDISNTQGPRSRDGGAKTQAHRAMRNMRSIFNFAMARYRDSDGEPIFKANPVLQAFEVIPWNKQRRRQRVIFDHELKRWYTAVLELEVDTSRDFLLLLLFTGLRR
ncbi:MAG: Arm DNA-binding domain-containing protein, partial [Cyanobacteria bacterium]|nr:Arm DNA-binding domain-containing protein [Cyanobacteriota bacterium]